MRAVYASFNLDSALALGPDQLRQIARDTLGAADPATEAGRQQLATLERLAPAWQVIIDASQAMFDGAASSADAAGRAAAEAAQQALRDAAERARAEAQLREEQARAQQAMIAAWQRLTDSIAETMRKLRGELLSPAAGFAAKQAEFALATAAARAGDQKAAGQLPALAQSVVELGRAVASTQVDQSLLTGRTLASLAATLDVFKQFGVAVPAFAAGGYHAGGLRLVGENGPELEMTGPSRIYSAAQTRALFGGGDAMTQELQALRAEVAALREIARATAGHTAKTARTLERFDDGDALKTRATA